MFTRVARTSAAKRCSVRISFQATSFSYHPATSCSDHLKAATAGPLFTHTKQSQRVFTSINAANRTVQTVAHPCGRDYQLLDLLDHPKYHASDLGQPLPASPHAISVAMPLWEHVVGYEEGNKEIMNKLYCGYPRFCLHPYVKQLFDATALRFNDFGGETACYVFPSKCAAVRCKAFVSSIAGFGAPINLRFLSAADGTATLGADNWAVVFPQSLQATVHKFWQHYGEVISSRQAHALLENRWQPADAAIQATLKDRIASAFNTEGSSNELTAADDVYLYSSGMGAIASGLRLMQNVRPAKKTIQVGFPYLDSLKMQSIMGAGCHLFTRGDAHDLQQIEKLLQSGDIAGVMTEFPSNPLLTTVDLPQLYALCQRFDVPLMVDDTVASFASCNTLRYCDVTLSSLSKWFSGRGDVLAGSIALNQHSKFYSAFKQFLTSQHRDVLYRCDAEALEENSRDYVARVQQSIETTVTLTDYLRSHPLVKQLFTADARNVSPDIKKFADVNAVCGLFSLELHGPTEVSSTFYDTLRCSKGPSLGTDFTLVCPYTLLAHYNELQWCQDHGIPANLLRVSVGVEPAGELLQRFDEALQNAQRVHNQHLANNLELSNKQQPQHQLYAA